VGSAHPERNSWRRHYWDTVVDDGGIEFDGVLSGEICLG